MFREMESMFENFFKGLPFSFQSPPDNCKYLFVFDHYIGECSLLRRHLSLGVWERTKTDRRRQRKPVRVACGGG
jgi:hypothetical protein